ncbi:hypothetical protein L0F63_005361, partial [Massospora cicadina]
HAVVVHSWQIPKQKSRYTKSASLTIYFCNSIPREYTSLLDPMALTCLHKSRAAYCKTINIEIYCAMEPISDSWNQHLLLRPPYLECLTNHSKVSHDTLANLPAQLLENVQHMAQALLTLKSKHDLLFKLRRLKP